MDITYVTYKGVYLERIERIYSTIEEGIICPLCNVLVFDSHTKNFVKARVDFSVVSSLVSTSWYSETFLKWATVKKWCKLSYGQHYTVIEQIPVQDTDGALAVLVGALRLPTAPKYVLGLEANV